ncbi:hypothetical protein LTR84_009129 [Exophiala bonariae]|uniref:Zn(2)-C6 fungal-type domain-containing protein n=1 Tax=Exophiala bonariae TaxID=1690606 RepID=A0AAV9MVM3_9EURO|nr:hypothetical protein LTR84_009129 [Exophiala bonariae]
MSAGVFGAEKRSAKRAQQACLNCRQKKARCNGEKPVCRTCAESFLSCRWAIGSASGSRTRATVLRNETLATRISILEQQLKSIAPGTYDKAGMIEVEAEVNLNSIRANSHANISSTAVVPITPNDPIQLPSQSMFAGIIDDFFKYCHNQPYSYFRERTFRRQHSHRKLPVYLLYAFAATAIRFSPLFFATNDGDKLVQPYCDIAWTQVTQYAFHPTSELDITLVQTSSLLSVIDFIHGHHELAWMKIGLAIRFAQALHLHQEPDSTIPDHEQEARRRTFWSIYLLDRLISISSHRPTMLTDIDCIVRLPDAEAIFQEGRTTPQVPNLYLFNERCSPFPYHELSHFARVVVIASSLGRVVKYSMATQTHYTQPPWLSSSEYSEILGSLRNLESRWPLPATDLGQLVEETVSENNNADQQPVSHFVFSQALLHLSHCLLDHPALLHHRCRSHNREIPHSFLAEALERCRQHASDLLALLDSASNCGCVLESSVYGYCALTAGTLHSLFEHHENAAVALDSTAKVSVALHFLQTKAERQQCYKNMAISLKKLKIDPSTARVLVSPSVLARRNLAFDDQLLRELLEFAHVIKAPVLARPIQENATLDCQSTLSQSSHLPSERSNFGPLDYLAAVNTGPEIADMPSNFNCRDLLGEEIGDIWDDVMHANSVADIMSYRTFS